MPQPNRPTPNPPARKPMRKPAFIGLSIALAGAAAQAAPTAQFVPSVETVSVGQVFELVLRGMSFNLTAGGAVINNLTGGQHLDLTYSNTQLELLQITLDPRWTFATGNKTGTIDAAHGAVTGLAFGVFPATPDDDFNIATFQLRALAAGPGTLALVAGQFIGRVAGVSGQRIGASLGQANLTVLAAVPEPQPAALLLAGLGGLAVLRWQRRRR